MRVNSGRILYKAPFREVWVGYMGTTGTWGRISGIVTTKALGDEGTEQSYYIVGERFGKSRLPWEEPWISVNGDLTSIFSPYLISC